MADTVHELVVPEDVGRLDRWLSEVLEISRGRAVKLVDAGCVWVNGEHPSKASRRMRGGEAIKVIIPEPPDTRLVHQDIPVPILYEDDHVIVVDKPAGLVVHPGKGHLDGTLANALLDRIDPHCGHPERPGIVHRLDMGTSGVMCVAKTQAGYDGLTKQFAAHTVDRRYLALCWGYAKEDKGTIDRPLARHPGDRKRFAVVEGGKRAVTHWSVVSRAKFKVPGGDGWVSWIQCRLETGRTHQVRVHLSSLGHPLIGDTMYHRPLYKPRTQVPKEIREAVKQVDHELLHARMLGFAHPVTGERIEYQSDPPADYMAVLDSLGLSI